MSQRDRSARYDEWHERPLGREDRLKFEEGQSHLRALLANCARPVLVVGCGSRGEMSVVQSSVTAYAVDLSLVAVKRSRTSFPANLYSVADGEALPFRDSIFRTVLCSEVLEHVESQDSLLGELRRVASKDARVLVTTPNWISLYGLARFLARMVLRRDVTSGGQQLDAWNTRWRLARQIRAAGLRPTRWWGFWFFPPTGVGRVRPAERVLVAVIRVLMPFDRALRRLLPWAGHSLCVECRVLDQAE